MGMMREDPRHKIVSLRVSREDYRFLVRLSERQSVCVSDLMREALREVLDAFAEEVGGAEVAGPEFADSLSVDL